MPGLDSEANNTHYSDGTDEMEVSRLRAVASELCELR